MLYECRKFVVWIKVYLSSKRVDRMGKADIYSPFFSLNGNTFNNILYYDYHCAIPLVDKIANYDEVWVFWNYLRVLHTTNSNTVPDLHSGSDRFESLRGRRYLAWNLSLFSVDRLGKCADNSSSQAIYVSFIFLILNHYIISHYTWRWPKYYLSLLHCKITEETVQIITTQHIYLYEAKSFLGS
jgi:hypothetical protein